MENKFLFSFDKSYYTLFYNVLLQKSTESSKILLKFQIYRHHLGFSAHSSWNLLSYSALCLLLDQPEFIHVHHK